VIEAHLLTGGNVRDLWALKDDMSEEDFDMLAEAAFTDRVQRFLKYLYGLGA
jgi:hypothetical protein